VLISQSRFRKIAKGETNVKGHSQKAGGSGEGGKGKPLLGMGRAFSNLAFYKSDQQHMQVSTQPQASIMQPHSSTGPEHSQSKVSSTFVFSLRADFSTISFFVSFFLMLAILDLLYTVPSTNPTLHYSLDGVF
jgi:hypothetical protein